MGEYKENDWHFWKCGDQCCHLDRIWNLLEMSCSMPLGNYLDCVIEWEDPSIVSDCLTGIRTCVSGEGAEQYVCIACFLPDFRHSISNCFKYFLLPSSPGSCASNCEPKKGNSFCFKLFLPGILSQQGKKCTLEGSKLDGREKLLGGEMKEPFIHS